MKQLFLLILPFVTAYALSAQNWQLFNTQEVYHYKSSLSSNAIDESIFVDSIQIVNTDSLFILNERVVECSTCQNWTESYYLRHQDHFVLQKIQKQSNGRYILEGKTQRWYIYSNGIIGDSWIFDSTQNIMAIVTAIYQSNILGINDSIKRISLSNNKEILIGKKSGLCAFPSLQSNEIFTLCGLQHQNIGEHVPTIAEIYNFEVGDVFFYLNGSGGMGDYYCEKVRKEVLSKEVFPNYVKYYYKVDSKSSSSSGFGVSACYKLDPPYTPSYNHFFDSSTYHLSPWYIENQYQGFYQNPASFLNHCYHEVIGTSDTADVAPNVISYDVGWGGGINKKSTGTDYFSMSNNDTFFVNTNNSFLIRTTCQSGLGMTSFSGAGFEGGYGGELTGYIHNGISYGTTYELWYYTGNEEKELQEKGFHLSPNPCRDEVNLDLLTLPQNGTSIHIFTLNGLLVKSIDIDTPQTSMSTKDLAAGVYIVELNNQQKYSFQKLIILE